MWASTANDHYSLGPVHPGDTVAAADSRLKLTGPFTIGLNRWYLSPNGAATAILKVRRGIVQEIGIGDTALMNGRTAQLNFLKSFF